MGRLIWGENDVLLRFQMPAGQKFYFLQVAVLASIVMNDEHGLLQADSNCSDFRDEKPAFRFITDRNKLVNRKRVTGVRIKLGISRLFRADRAPREQVDNGAFILPIGIKLG